MGFFSKFLGNPEPFHFDKIGHSNFSYLGATVNYYNFERATAMTRIKASDKTGQQLHRWLYSNSKSLTGYAEISTMEPMCIRHR